MSSDCSSCQEKLQVLTDKIWKLADYLHEAPIKSDYIIFPTDIHGTYKKRPYQGGYSYPVTWKRGENTLEVTSGFFDHHKSLYTITKRTQELLTQDLLDQLFKQLEIRARRKAQKEDEERIYRARERRIDKRIAAILED